MRKMRLFLVLLFLGLVFAEQAAEENKEPLTDVAEIVEKANIAAYYQGQDGKAVVAMTITDSKGQKRTREFTILRSNVEEGGDQNYYVYFTKPADVRNMVFMVHKKAAVDVDDDRWLYMPSLDLVNRIAASDKRTSFVGSDYLYEDVSGRSLEEDKHELIETIDEHYLVKNTPLKPDAVEFKYYNVYISRENLMPFKMEYFKDSDKPYRVIEALDIEDVDGYPTVTKAKVQNFETGSTTLMEFSNVQYDINLGDIFTERYLRRPPREARR